MKENGVVVYSDFVCTLIFWGGGGLVDLFLQVDFGLSLLRRRRICL